MKKSLFLLGAAVAAFASCTNEEVMDMPQNRAINFEAFTNAATRANAADNEVTGITDFWVIGQYGYNGTAVDVYNNEFSTKKAWWQPSQTYRFAGYYDGTANARIDGATFAPTTGTLTINNYTADNSKDLLAAVSAEVTTDADVTNEDPVTMTFNHLLSEVKFTFTTEDSEAHTLTISNLKINGAAVQGNVSYNGTATWTPSGTAGYTLDNIPDVADADADYTASTAAFVIPQTGTNTFTVTFTATVTGAGFGETGITGNFSATLDYDGSVEGTTANTWTPGFRYNYTASISAKDIDPDLEDNIIEFTPSVTPWKDADNTTVTPTKQN